MTRMADRDLLDRIDDVITWHGSRDAMEWTAEPPKFPSMPAPVDPEAARQLVVRLGAQVQAFVDAFQPVAEQVARAVNAFSAAFAEIVNSPGMRELGDAHRQAQRAMKTEYARRRRARGRRR